MARPEGADPQRVNKAQAEDDLKKEAERIRNESLPDRLANLKGTPGRSAPFKLEETKTQSIGGTVTLDKVYGVSEPGGIHQILGVSSPNGGTDTNLFTVLAAHTCQVSVLWVANRRSIEAKIRVGFDIAGAGTNTVPDAAWLYFEVPIPGHSTLVLDAATGLWLGASDDVVVRTDVGGVSFGASGSLYATG